MAYCDITDVQGKGTMAGRPFSPVSNPTQAEVQARIDYRATENAPAPVIGTAPAPVGPAMTAEELDKRLEALEEDITKAL